MKYVVRIEKVSEFKADARDIYRSPAQTPDAITVLFEAEIKADQIEAIKKAVEVKK